MKFKKYCTVFIAFIMYFNVFSQAHAAKNYNVKTIVYDPLAKVIEATTLDRIAEKTMQRTARVPVTASATGSTVASMIRFGVAGALIYGVVEGAGWIIENGIVKKPVESQVVDPSVEFVWVPINVDQSSSDPKCRSRQYYPTTTLAIAHSKSCAELQEMKNITCSMTSISQIDCKGFWKNDTTPSLSGQIFREKNPNYNPNLEPKYVPVPETELGDKVNNSPQAPQIIPDVYNPNNPAGGKAPQATSDALDRAVPVPETEPEGSTQVNPETGKGTFKLPAFCEWASVMCAWYEKYQDDSKKTDEHRDLEKDVWKQEKTAREEEKQHREDEKTFWQKVTDFFDWAQKEPEKEDTEVDILDQEKDEPDTSIHFATECPAKFPLTFNWNGQTLDFSFDFTIWCQAISTFVYPIVVALGSLHALYIVAGVRQDG